MRSTTSPFTGSSPPEEQEEKRDQFQYRSADLQFAWDTEWEIFARGRDFPKCQVKGQTPETSQDLTFDL